MHLSGLINFMDPLPEHVVNESRNYKHQASSTPCCINRQVTAKSQAWTCGCFCFNSKGCMQRTSGSTWKVTQALTLVMLPIPAFPGAAIGTFLWSCRKAVCSSWGCEDRACCVPTVPCPLPTQSGAGHRWSSLLMPHSDPVINGA